jgi:hypothetical protein
VSIDQSPPSAPSHDEQDFKLIYGGDLESMMDASKPSATPRRSWISPEPRLMLRWQIYAWAKQPEMPSHERSAEAETLDAYKMADGVLRQAQSDVRHHLEGGTTGRGDCGSGRFGARPSRRRPPAIVRWPAQGDRVAAQRERAAVKAQGEEAEKAREKYEAKVDELQASIKALDDAMAALDPWSSALDVVSATLDRRADALDRFVKGARPN